VDEPNKDQSGGSGKSMAPNTAYPPAPLLGVVVVIAAAAAAGMYLLGSMSKQYEAGAGLGCKSLCTAMWSIRKRKHKHKLSNGTELGEIAGEQP